jgi:two-component system, sensor histidine kinase and response regulator
VGGRWASTSGSSLTRFAVVDTGCGIRTRDQEKLFEAFAQVANATAAPYEGSGLGLHICQLLAPLLGAAITFESAFGVGSTFTLEIETLNSAAGSPASTAGSHTTAR